VIRLWGMQIRAVIRLEIKKTFFSKRGLWIYLVALLPVLLFTALAIATAHERNARSKLAQRSEKPLSEQDLRAVKTGMTSDQVIARLGKPPSTSHWVEPRWSESGPSVKVAHENYHYSDGENDLYVRVTNGKVELVEVREGMNRVASSILFAGIFQFFFIRLVVFFGCLGIFMNLFRGEILDRSLHFYFLAPLRREILMIGKFLAGLLATWAIFLTSQGLQTVAFLWHFTPGARDLYLYHDHGLEHAAMYMAITVLGCVGYGAFFLAAGMFFRNPILPTALILIWEWINPFLPSVLKQFSVIYYLKALCPLEIPAPPGTSPLLSLLVSNPEPIALPIALLGLAVVVLVILYGSSIRVRRMEVNYTTE
jgi:hypothetical protein